MSFEKISVIGLGYIGLPTAAMFASNAKFVVGVDVNEETVNTINRGAIHIVEPHLDALVEIAVKNQMLKATTIAQQADAFLIAVPTPFKDENSDTPYPDLSYIKSAAESIAPVLKKGDLVVLESTSPVGATEKLVAWLAALRTDLKLPVEGCEDQDIFVAYCPERVLPGNVVKELVDNDRAIGGITPLCSAKAAELYKIFVKGECVVTNAKTAEMAKLTENASRDVSIAFANELSYICDDAGIDVWELIKLANRHPRVNILQPGPGVGGHCIAVDPWFIVSSAPKKAKLIRAAREINDSKPAWVVDKVKSMVAEYLAKHNSLRIKDINIVCYGLAFKPNIDDLRESPALFIAKALTQLFGDNCYSVEPNVNNSKNVSGINLIEMDKAVEIGDVHVLLVDHREFKGIPTPSGVIIDTKGIWEIK